MSLLQHLYSYWQAQQIAASLYCLPFNRLHPQLINKVRKGIHHEQRHLRQPQTASRATENQPDRS